MKQYIVDAFTKDIFHGNQAAVCVLEQWLSEDIMMSIAKENNFSETAFIVKEGEKYHLRWFTPGGEIDLCGHATLASAYVLLNYYMPNENQVVFTTLSGDLTVVKNGELLEMEFPAYDLKEVAVTDEMEQAIGYRPTSAFMGRDLLCILDDEEKIINAKPDMDKVKSIDGLLLHITAKGKNVDCVSRSFAPKLAVIEDPVCGSGHCHIAPYWSKVLDKTELVAYQASQRGGTLYCRLDGDKVFISGEAALFATSELNL